MCYQVAAASLFPQDCAGRGGLDQVFPRQEKERDSYRYPYLFNVSTTKHSVILVNTGSGRYDQSFGAGPFWLAAG